MQQNPYTPPGTEVRPAPAQVDVPESVMQKIKGAWIAAVVSGCMTLVVTLVALSGKSYLGFDAWNSIDVLLIFGLAYGIYRKSRTCAVLMFVYFAISKIMLFAQTGQVSGAVFGLVFLYFYGRGVLGTFEYHKLRKTGEAP
jgi:serine/threonine-protein kinase